MQTIWPVRVAFVLTLLAQGPQGWYKQANFYRTPESQLSRYNKQTNQLETVMQFTPEQELSIGAQGYQSLVAGQALIQDPEVLAYMDRLVGRLTGATPGPPFPYKVTLIQAPDVVNAVTPPGHVVIYSGIIAKAESEAMLAATLAHELAHNYGHHVARRMIRTAQAQMLADAALQSLNNKGDLARRLGLAGAQYGVGLFVNAYSRFEEKEADLYGVHLLYNAGFNPTWMSEMFLRLGRETARQPPKWLSTHPPHEDRASYISAYLEKFQLNKELQVDSADFQNLRARLGLQQTPVPVVAGAYTPPSGGMPSLRGASGPSVPNNNQPRNPPPPTQPQAPPNSPGTPNVDSRGSLMPPAGGATPPAPTTALPPTAEPLSLPPPVRDPVSPPAPPTQPPGPPPISPPAASAGVIIWSGHLEKGEVFTIDSSTPSIGRMSGGLPGAPVRIDVDAKEFAIVEPPAPSNGWKRLSLRSKNRRHTVITVQWNLLTGGIQ